MGSNVTATERWYGVRLVFRVLNREDHLYEERVTLWRARSIEEAIARAEAEVLDYADPNERLFEYIGLAQAFQTDIPDRAPGSGDEVFSLIRGSDLEPSDYLDRFFDTGTERQGRTSS